MYQTVDTTREGKGDKEIEVIFIKICPTPIHLINIRTIKGKHPLTHLAVDLLPTKRVAEALTEEGNQPNHLAYIFIITKDGLWQVGVALDHHPNNFAIMRTMKCISMHHTD